jgi:GcrA cell cycle regulator
MNINQTNNTLPWTPDRVAQLEKLWIEGKSAAEIVDTLKGTTRAAVIGKIHRLGIAGSRTPQTAARREPSAPEVKRDAYAGNSLHARKGRPTRPFDLTKSKTDSTPQQRAEKAAAGKTLIGRTVDPANDNAVPLLGRRFNQCAWPVGMPDRPALQLCCGAPVPENANRSVASYCTAHAERAVARVLAGGKPDPERYERAIRRWAA